MDCESKPLPGGGDDWEQSSILGDLRQRRIISILLERSRPTTTRELGVQLAAREAGIAPADVTETECLSVQTDLHHRCLPKLEAVGWVERRPEGVVVDEPPSIGADRLSPPDLRTPEHPAWDAVSVLLERPYRQDIAANVLGRRHPAVVAELAADLRSGRPALRTALPDNQMLRATLHHVDLPKLADVGLIEYDTADRTVTRTRRLSTFADRVDLDAN